MKKTIPLFIGIIIISVLTIAVTAYSGYLFQRWGYFEGLPEARELLRQLPMEINGWVAEEDVPLRPGDVAMLKIQDAYVNRVYRNAERAEVHFTLMVGPSGRITVHTPEICFGGRDFSREAARTPVPIDVQLDCGREVVDTFWRVNFVNRAIGANNRISFYYGSYHGVRPADVWHAVERPRRDLQRFRFVYRIQVQAHSVLGDERDTARQFLEDALPTIHRYLKQRD